MRPRRLPLDPEAAEIRRPLSAINPSEPNRSSRPVITTSERPSSPLSKPGRSRQEEPYYLQPASSTRREHRRNYTLDSADPARSAHGDRDRADRGGYRSSGIGGGRSGYNLNQPLVRQSNDRDRGGYEYTDPREQMYRDTEPRPRPRRDSYSGGGRERPLSMTGLEDYNMPRVERTNRDAGPPVSMRGFVGLGRSGSLRQGLASRDYDVSSDFSRNDYERRKAHIPRVALHQDPDDVYSAYRDDESAYDDPRDRRPRKTAFQDEVPAPKPREAYDEQFDRARRPKPHVDNGAVDVRPKERYPETYDRPAEDKSRRHHDRHHHRDERDEDRERRRREDAARELRPEPPRERRDDVPRERRDDGHRERRDDGHRERRDEVPREKHYHADHGLDNELALGGAAAATGLAAEAARSHHRHKDSWDDRDTRLDLPRDAERDRPATHMPAESTSASTVSRESDEERRERRRRRRERRDREEREARGLEDRQRRKAADGLAIPKEPPAREAIAQGPEIRETAPRDPPSREPLPREPDLAPPSQNNAIREQPSYERRPHDGRLETAPPPPPPPQASPRRRHHHSRSQDYDSFSDSSSSTSLSSSSRRPSRARDVHVVTPPPERAPSQPPAPPKSILRAPRQKFPEDPAPVREGVAPLKDAGKKGIPPNARWTKIDRKLVNPEALEAGNERYEERVDYVIVLRVLKKEEIEQYAAKTQELRAARAVAQGQQQEAQGKAGRPEDRGMPEWG